MVKTQNLIKNNTSFTRSDFNKLKSVKQYRCYHFPCLLETSDKDAAMTTKLRSKEKQTKENTS